MKSSSLMMGMFSSCAFLFFEDIEAVSLLIRKLVDLLTLPVTFPPLAFDVGFQFVAVFVMVDVARDDKRQFVATCSRRLRFLLLHVQKVEQAGGRCVVGCVVEPTHHGGRLLRTDAVDVCEEFRVVGGRGQRCRCHALALQERGLNVTAVDISPLSCETMKERGVANVECVNIFNQRFQERFDTLLLLMNGTGIAGKLSRLPQLLSRLKQLMNPSAQILIDSSDLRYVYEDENGVLDVDLDGAYYGEVDYQMTYRNIIGKSFDWLYADSVVLAECCRQCGLKCEILAQGNHYDYLARIVQM